jgi:hypothetical protein
MHGS